MYRDVISRGTVIVERCSKPAVGLRGSVVLAHIKFVGIPHDGTLLLWHPNDNSHGVQITCILTTDAVSRMLKSAGRLLLFRKGVLVIEHHWY